MGSVTALAVTAASAAGLGSGGSAAVLGQPLDYAVQVRLDAGEVLSPACVVAEVTTGDRRIPPGLVRTVVEMTGPETARVRVITQTSIDEPVIGIHLSMGCPARISRRYVVMVDPPINAVVATVPAHAATPAAAPEPDPARAPAAAPARAAEPLRAAQSEGAGTTLAPVSSRSGAPPPAAATERQAQRRAERRAAARAARSRAPAVARQSARPTAEAKAPARLKLDPVEPPVPSAEAAAVEEALDAVAQAASAARATAAAASAAAERIATLERTVNEIRAESKTSRDLALQFRQRLSAAEGSSSWMLPLALVAALLAALAAWLAWRLGRLQAERQQSWRDATATRKPEPGAVEATPSRQPTAPIPFVTSELGQGVARPPVQRARSAPAWPPPAPPVPWPAAESTLPPEPLPATEPDMQRTTPITPGARFDEGAPRDVSIEELIDLEQQAEFFVVLGQDDAAIELLAEHLRTTGGGSPLPYLKLLEIQQRRGDRQAYEHMRARFNQRFNAYAPEWGVDLSHGLTLDDYPGVIPRLQQVWAQPLDTMAELEALLFRKSRGELFDLPAYREVLFLYSLARDLLDRTAGDTGDVDLLLPMADGGEFKDAAPSRHVGLERDAFRDTLPPDERPTGPVDFDLSAAERPTSIFDLLDEAPQPPRRSA